MSLEQLNHQVVLANSLKRHFDRDASQYAEQIKDEALELVAEINESLVTGSVVNVVGEIGDLYVLLAQLCHDLGIKPQDAMRYKMIRNDLKYSQYVTNNGYERSEAIKMSKNAWKALGGDYKYSEVYLDHLSDEN